MLINDNRNLKKCWDNKLKLMSTLNGYSCDNCRLNSNLVDTKCEMKPDVEVNVISVNEKRVCIKYETLQGERIEKEFYENEVKE